MKTLITLITITVCFWACSTEGQKDGKPNEAVNNETISDASSGATHEKNMHEDKSGAVASNVAGESHSFSELKVGMKDEKVRTLLGKPSKVDVIDPTVAARVEDWWYGSNQKVRMTGGQVTRIIKDVEKHEEILTKISEAREKGNDAEVERLMQEIDSTSTNN